jgi:uncharacterized protein involved in response to NO
MKFPVCKHSRSRTAHRVSLSLLASEPFRLFFILGAVWSVIGVSLWPLHYGGWLEWFPGACHSRLMIQGFGGAFLLGFLGTAGPRMLSAPRLTPVELLLLASLHQTALLLHVKGWQAWGDCFFALSLALFAAGLAFRARHGKVTRPPPQMVLAFSGLIFGLTGALLLGNPFWMSGAGAWMPALANLLLNQGLLLAPVLGVGSFLFPRILGREFGDEGTPAQLNSRRLRAVIATALLLASFLLEAFQFLPAAYGLRAAVCAVYLAREVRWRRAADAAPAGPLSRGLRWSLAAGLAGLLLAAVFPQYKAGVLHLLFVGGFGLLMLVIGSRVLFGHSGDLEGFDKRSAAARAVVFLALLAAATRVTTAFLPNLTVSHHIYAALTWALVGILWLVWHRRRFLRSG